MGEASAQLTAWLRFCRHLPTVRRLPYEQRVRLYALTEGFLRRKRFSGAQGLVVDRFRQRLIAVHACLPVLNLGLDWLQGWSSLVIYPDEFLAPVVEIDPAGVVHEYLDPRSGESWPDGPLVLSWADVRQDTFDPCGNHVVIHEIAHKLDGLNGHENGFPPLHAQMSPSAWTDAFSHAFIHLHQQLAADETPHLDPYAGESPAEFFAVCSEVFFTQPEALLTHYPDVYQQLQLFYRQTPHLWHVQTHH